MNDEERRDRTEEGKNGSDGAERSVLKYFWHCYEREWTSDNPDVATSPPPPRDERNDDGGDDDDNDDNDQPSAGQEERAEARAYILDLGGWKSEIAPYRAVRRGHGGAL